MRFDLTDLQLFVHIHDAGSISAGAERAHMTLASASERIRGMEQVLGVPLLLRHRRGVSLTEPGRALLRNAHSVLRQMERLRGELGQYGNGLRGQVRLHCNTAALSEHLPALLGRFLRDNPLISVAIEEKLSYEIANGLRAGLCDIGVLSDAVDLDGLQTHTFRQDRLSLVVPREHRLAERRSVSLAEIADEGFIGLVEGSALSEHLDHHARRLGKRLEYRVRLHGFEAIGRMVGEGVGIAVLPRTAAIRCARRNAIHRLELDDPWAARNLLLCLRAGETPSRPVAQMVAQLLQPAPPALSCGQKKAP